MSPVLKLAEASPNRTIHVTLKNHKYKEKLKKKEQLQFKACILLDSGSMGNLSDLKEAGLVLNELLDMDRTNNKTLYDIAAYHSLMHEPNEAISYLLSSVHHGFKNGLHLRNDPFFENIKNTPQFGGLLAQINREIEQERPRQYSWPLSRPKSYH
eukprot:TRINITY_DN23730_c0_g1_i1.p1 TRINITY_DN23730_c0_g1~~TRINITY_DN23730_c0_g1_i1.p1  ORF type:complete len:155 (+),score=45.24 TRINITY_DN23730_c0_g1_i1:234-698(+)